MHSKLSLLRSQLQALQARRALVRWGSAVCLFALVLLGVWIAAFVVDVSLRLSLGYRFLLLVGWIAALAWSAHRFLWPVVATRESLEDLALVVERRHQIDTDLIGALQFESAAAQSWGSPRLTSAVIDYVADFTPGLNVFEGFTYEQLPKRFAGVLGTLLVIVVAAALFPNHVSAFWNRFWLGSARYPSRTVISELSVNGKPIPVISTGKNFDLRLPQGSSLDIRAVCSGEIPDKATVRLQNRLDRAEVRFDMKATEEPGRFAAEHALPSSDVELQVFAGDTWSDPLTVLVVPLPVVDANWQVVQPAYAASADEKGPSGTARYLAVLEGSELKLSVRGTNKKLAKVELKLDDATIPLVASSGAEPVFTLPAGSPLASVRKGESYEIHAVDEDGLSLTPPIAGSIRLKPDRAPRVASAIVTKLVLPTAKPRLAFGAIDDYGVSQVRVVVEVTRESGESESSVKVLKEIPAGSPKPPVLRDEIRLDLTPYKLEKGDELRLTVEAVDYRGDLEPKTGTGEPLLLKVTDRSGILSGLNESDQFTVKQLDTIILRELGIGGDKR
jgi:hypothetical protein